MTSTERFTPVNPCSRCGGTDTGGHFGTCPNMGWYDAYGNAIPAVPANEVRSKSSTGGEKGVKPERHSLIPVEPLNEVARHYGAGAAKYADHNWRRGYEFSKSYDAMRRHESSWWGGEDIDPEMGTSHLAAVVFHAFTLMELMKTHPEFDDRYKAETKEEHESAIALAALRDRLRG